MPVPVPTLPSSSLQPLERAVFATTSRLLSCLVTESLVSAFYRPLKNQDASGFAILLVGEAPENLTRLHAGDILAIVPLHHQPILKHNADDDTFCRMGKAIGLLDPLDMIPLVFESGKGRPTYNSSDILADIVISLKADGHVQLDKNMFHKSTDVLSLWSKVATSLKVDSDIQQEIASEFTNTVEWQAYSYEHPPEAPLFASPSIAWEQSIVEGHPTHPMYRLRRFLHPLPDYAPGEYDVLHPQLRFISIPREEAMITYDFESLVYPLVEAASTSAGKPLVVQDGHVLIPVHELQTVHIEANFSNAVVYPEVFSLPVLAQQSLRSVIIPNVYKGIHLKVALGMKLTSAHRGIYPGETCLGPRFSSQVVPALNIDRNILIVANVLASISHATPNTEIVHHCAAYLRECPEDFSEERGERIIVCSSLVEKGHSGTDGQTPSVIRIFGLDTGKKRLEWLKRYISTFLRAFIPPMLYNGVAFECHPQNSLARFDLQTKELKGFVIRDFGGLCVHRESLETSTGVDADFIAGNRAFVENIDAVYIRFYHTAFHNHLQQLIRVLGLHYNGLGWDIVREELREIIPSAHPLYTAWLAPERTTFPGKSFMRMRISGAYKTNTHAPFSNLLNYTGYETKNLDED